MRTVPPEYTCRRCIAAADPVTALGGRCPEHSQQRPYPRPMAAPIRATRERQIDAWRAGGLRIPLATDARHNDTRRTA